MTTNQKPITQFRLVHFCDNNTTIAESLTITNARMQAAPKVLKVELYQQEQHNVTVYFMQNSIDVMFLNEKNYGTILTMPRSTFETTSTEDLREKIKEVLTELIKQL